jgi:hypothetical protein
MDMFGSFPGSLGQDNNQPSLPVQRSRRRYGIKIRFSNLAVFPFGKAAGPQLQKAEVALLC